MIRQYGAQRFRCSLPMVPKTVGKGKKAHTEYFPQENDFGYKHRMGTIPVGTIVYLQDGVRPLCGFTQPIVQRNPWMVIAFTNREYYPAVKGAPPVKYVAGSGGVLVKSLRDGRMQQISDWLLLTCCDADLDWAKETWRKRLAGAPKPKPDSAWLYQKRNLRYAA